MGLAHLFSSSAPTACLQKRESEIVERKSGEYTPKVYGTTRQHGSATR